jgi:GST-like protein
LLNGTADLFGDLALRIEKAFGLKNGDFPVCETGAILLYLARKTGKLLPRDEKGESRVTQWLIFQMAGIGPMMGQANVFIAISWKNCRQPFSATTTNAGGCLRYWTGSSGAASTCATNTASADIAKWCWVHIYEGRGVKIDGLTNLQAWIARMEARPACQRGIAVPEPLAFKEPTAEVLKTAQKLVTR